MRERSRPCHASVVESDEDVGYLLPCNQPSKKRGVLRLAIDDEEKLGNDEVALGRRAGWSAAERPARRAGMRHEKWTNTEAKENKYFKSAA